MLDTVSLIQGTDQWLAARCGKVTASRISDLMARTKSGYGASRANYMAELVAETLTGKPAERFTNDAMRRGTEKEPEARSLYEFLCEETVEQVGFVPHPTIDGAGCSPDGLVSDDGLVEIKAPNTATHINTLLSETVDDKYLKQMQFQMACTGRKYCTFISFDDRLPASMRLFMKRIERDNKMIEEIEAEVALFLKEMNTTVDRLRAKWGD